MFNPFSSCCTCTADWSKRGEIGSHSSKKWWAVIPLVIINMVTLLIGICFLGVSSYVAGTFEAWQQYISWSGLIACVILSLCILMMGILGCCGAIKRSICMLTIYLFILFILCFIVFGVALVVLIYGENICGGYANDASTCSKNEASREVSNALIKIQTECCQSNMTVPLCKADDEKILYQCMYPECDGNNEGYCVTKFSPCILGLSKDYPGMVCERTFPPPMTKTPNAMCIGIKTLIFKDTKGTKAELALWKNHDEDICQADYDPMVEVSGYPANAIKSCIDATGLAEKTCLTNERVAFSKQMAAYFEDNMKSFGIGLVILGVFLIIIMFLAFAACCQGKTHLNANNNLKHDVSDDASA